MVLVFEPLSKGKDDDCNAPLPLSTMLTVAETTSTANDANDAAIVVAPGVVNDATSDDGGKSLRVTTKTAKVKWKRKVAVLKPKSSFASLVV